MSEAKPPVTARGQQTTGVFVWESPLLILGPAYSGKTAWACKLMDQAKPAIILRTAPRAYPVSGSQTGSPEPENAAVFQNLGQDPGPWKITSTGLDLTESLMSVLSERRPILVDSINQWIGRLIAEAGHRGKGDIALRVEEFLTQLQKAWLGLKDQRGPLILVSAEVGACPPSVTDHERFFRQTVGITNQRLAQWAETVVVVQAGIPRILKPDPLALRP